MTTDTMASELTTSGSAEGGRGNLSVRPVPYPYRAMLAICSDLDCTPNASVYSEMMRFLNTQEQTIVGKGVDLEVGNTIYFDMPPDQFAYWNTDDDGRAMIRDLIRSGHIDCLHSFGDLATTRDHAQRALDELAAKDCRIEVWVDHSKAPSNFGADLMVGSGDDASSPVYHADLTRAYGIQFVWRGRTTSVIGQNVPAGLEGLFSLRHPLASGRTMLKQAIKFRLGRKGDQRYAMHPANRVLRKASLRDQSPVYEFMRFNPHWRGVGDGATATGIADVLTSRVLDRMVDSGSVGVLYTHLGKSDDERCFFNRDTVEAFRLLRSYQDQGKILVTTTRRLLGYLRTLAELQISTCEPDKDVRIDLSLNHAVPRPGGSDDARDLEGLTFYGAPDRVDTCTVNGTINKPLQRNEEDHSGRPSYSVPWSRLEYPR